MDTADVLRVRAGLQVIEQEIADLRRILADLSKKYRNTLMAGRTHLQQALPITFGYKTAIWLAMFDRHAERLEQLKPRVLVGEFAGAAGTLASLGDKGPEVQKAFCEELGLGVPVSTWHVARDGFAEVVNLLGLITGSLGKVALDVMIMASTEFAELYEPFVKGRGASSTMPQKRNPISSELMLAASKGVRQHAGLMLDAMIHDFERATGPWHAEWIAIPESFVLTAGALNQAKLSADRLANRAVHVEWGCAGWCVPGADRRLRSPRREPPGGRGLRPGHGRSGEGVPRRQRGPAGPARHSARGPARRAGS
jgi:3-carboxy-cis,cis-muconate cycloisomerase